MAKKLTHEIVAMRTKCDRLENLKKLNLWGSDIEDVAILKQMYNLEVVSLSVNSIKSLKDFAFLKNLKELYLRKNYISDLGEIRYLSNCTNLKVLWLSENPVADHKNYRKTVIKVLPNLEKLDDLTITVEERENAEENEKIVSNNDTEEYNDNSLEEAFERKEEENVFESGNFNNYKKIIESNYDDNPYPQTNRLEEVYSKNKIKDKFPPQNSNIDHYAKKHSQNQINTQEEKLVSNYDNNNYKRTKTVQENSRKISEGIKEKNYFNNNIPQRDLNKNSGNVLQSILILLKELNLNELEMVKEEIDKKL
jgi:hypothetical protein